MATQAAQTGFVGWVMANGQIVLFFAQILFWLALSVAAGWAAVVFNRYVTFMIGSKPAEKSADKPASKAISVEEFVE